MKKILFLAFLTCQCISVFAQKYELGKVTVDELSQKNHGIDSSAIAAVLFKEAVLNIDDYGYVVFKVKTKIKVYKKNGYEYANFELPFYPGSIDDVSVINANTYNLENGQIVKTKLDLSTILIEKKHKYLSLKKILMPNVREGSIIEYEIKMIGLMDNSLRWDFQESIPVNYSKFTSIIPEEFVFKRDIRGFYFPIVKTKTADTYGYLAKQTDYLMEGLPAIKNDVYIDNIDNYKSCLSLELEMYNSPRSKVINFSSNWDAVAKRIYNYSDFGDELKKVGYFEDDLKIILTGLVSPEDKINAILNFLKTKVKWNDYYGFSCDDGVKNAYKTNLGNVAEINLMLTSMLRYANLKANPVLISTKENGVALFPSIAAFDYVICAVETQDGLILLDATNQHSMPNILPNRDLNGFGRMIRNDGTSEEVNLMPKLVSKEVANVGYQLKPDGTITGKIKKQYSDYFGWTFRDKYNSVKEELYLEGLETAESIDVTDYTRENQNDLGKPIIESYSFTDKKSSEIIADKIYFSPLLFLALNENPFKQEVREYPIDFSFPANKRYNVLIDLPEGYAVETLPAPINIAAAENIGSFKYFITNTGNKIQISATFDINQAIVAADYYDILKTFFKQLIEKQTEKVVLKKI